MKSRHAPHPIRSSGFDRLLQYFQQTAVLALTAFGFLFCLISSYSLTVLTERAVWATLAFVALFSALGSLKRSGLWMLACLLLAGLWIWRNADELTQGVLYLLEQALDPLSLCLPNGMQALIAELDAQAAVIAATRALVALMFFVSLLTACFVVCRASLFGQAISTLPLLLPAAFCSLAPSALPFFCLVCAYLMQYVLGVSRRAAEPARARRDAEPSLQLGKKELSSQYPVQRLLALSTLPVVVLAALLSGLILPSRDYTRPERIEALREELLSLDLGNLFQNSNDGLTNGSFRNLSAIRFTGETVLKLRLEEERALYLRGYAGAVYTANGWKRASDASYGAYAKEFLSIAPQNLRAAALEETDAGYAQYTISVQNVAARTDTLWTPNGLITEAGAIAGAVNVQDTALGAARASGVGDYTLSAYYCPPTPSDIPFDAAEANAETLKTAYQAAAAKALGLSDTAGASAERVRNAAGAYASYVFDVYTALPEETQQAAEALISAYGLSLRRNEGALDIYATCYDLHALLSERCDYAYSPPRIPSGEDFTTYFIQESRSGYCVHFATAATVLLRALGVPARYAEGYIVVLADYNKTPDENGYIDIEDTHAHAWVEVFDPVQLEWIPVEMTADATGGDAAPAGSNETESVETPTPTPTPTPTLTPTPTPTATPEEDAEQQSPEEQAAPTPAPAEESAVPEDGATPAPPEASAPDGEDGGGAPQSDSGYLSWLLPALALSGGLLLAAFAWRRARRERRRKQFTQPDTNAAVLAVGRCVMDMLRFSGCAPIGPLQTPEEYVPLAGKALPWLDTERLRRLLELAQRARFSGRACSKRERDEAAAFAAELRDGMSGRLKRPRRWLFDWRYPKL